MDNVSLYEELSIFGHTLNGEENSLPTTTYTIFFTHLTRE